MGTNFYWVDKHNPFQEELKEAKGSFPDKEDFCWRNNIFRHIGKRSAAGLYCWDCGSTLRSHGTHSLHGSSYPGEPDAYRFKSACPVCRKEKDENYDGLSKGQPAHTELFSPGHIRKERPSGISGGCSFTWTFMKQRALLQLYAVKHPKGKVVVNEYGEKFTAKDFLHMIETMCPIQYQTGEVFC